mmetsp:Transcript_4483/g.6397  ORF Transcript_4483/g.6397 Transcript_4483/m.6397 type:complete len:94 (+) Transcript_4483:8-289(+)
MLKLIILRPIRSHRCSLCRLSLNEARSKMTTLHSFDEREKGEELVYMKKQEKLLIDNLRRSKKISKFEIEQIVAPRKLPDDIIQKLIEWKHKQ